MVGFLPEQVGDGRQERGKESLLTIAKNIVEQRTHMCVSQAALQLAQAVSVTDVSEGAISGSTCPCKTRQSLIDDSR